MPIAVLTSKGQMTIPREIRDSLKLRPSDKIVIVLEKGQAILKPLRGNIMDLAGSVEIPKSEKPIDFQKVREKVKKKIARAAGSEA
jgi:AbrB family looped-hinge helix DNA binding protein